MSKAMIGNIELVNSYAFSGYSTLISIMCVINPRGSITLKTALPSVYNNGVLSTWLKPSITVRIGPYVSESI